MRRFLIATAVALFPSATLAQCVPPTSPSTSPGCWNIANAPGLSDYVLAWQPGQVPNPQRLLQVSQLIALMGNNWLPLSGGALTGSVSITAGGGWSSFNWGRQLLLTTPTGFSSPAIALTDGSGGNLWGISDGGVGGLSFAAMPAYNDNLTPPNVVMTLTTSLASFSVLIGLSSYTVATLPACTTATRGFAQVSDFSGTPAYNGALTGGGSTYLPVYCNGASWRQH